MVGHTRKYITDSLRSGKQGLRWTHQLLAVGVLAVLAMCYSSRSDAQTCPAYAPADAEACAPISVGNKTWWWIAEHDSEAEVIDDMYVTWGGPGQCQHDQGSSSDVAGAGNNYTGGIQTRGVRNYDFPYRYQFPDCDNVSVGPVEYYWSREISCPAGFEIAANSANTAGVCYRPAATPDRIKNLGGCSPTSPPLGPEPPKECPLAGNPINVATLNKFETQADYVGSGTFPLVFTRYYNSQSSLPETAPPAVIRDSSYFGLGWTATYFQFLKIENYAGTNYVTAYRPDGRGLRFAGTTSVYASETDITSVLTKVASGWQLKTADGILETYASDGRLLSIRSMHGETQSLTYDGSNRLVSVSDNFGHTLQFEYSSGGANAKISALVDPSGHRTYYSTAANLAQVTYPDSTSRQYAYRSGDSTPHLLTGIIDENNSQLSTFTYDETEDGNAVETSRAGGVHKYTVTYSYGYGYGYASVTDPLGNERSETITTINGVNHLLDTGNFCASCPPPHYLEYDTNGNVSSRTDPNGIVTSYSYNLTRNLETSRTEAIGTAKARKTTTQWHATHRLPTLITEPKRKTGFTYDSNGNVLTRTVTDTSKTPNVSRTWTYTYDSYGRVLTEDGPRSDVADTTTYTYYTCSSGGQCGQLQTVTNALGHVKTFLAYNSHGQPTSIMDENSTITTITYDLRQRVLSRSTGADTAQYQYWPTGQIKKVTLPDTSFFEFFYDAAHRPIETRDALGNRLVYTLDNAGNPLSKERIDASGAVARTESRVFDTLGQLWKIVSAVESGSQVTEFIYDSAGNVIGSMDAIGRQTESIYDELNRLKQVTTGAGQVIKYGYDGLNNVTSITDPRNKVTTYTYNGFSENTQLVSPDTGTSIMTYDTAGNLLTHKDARNIVTTYAYDAISRLTSVAFGDQTLTLNYDSGANGYGRLTSASDASQSQAWGYDAAGRVVSANQTVDSFSATTSYGYANSLLTLLQTPSGQSITYSYSDGNISGISVNGITILNSIIHEPFGPPRQWTWGDATLAVRSRDTDGRLSLIDSGGDLRQFSYDEVGRITQNNVAGKPTQSWSYTYDNANALLSAQRSGATYAWTYDVNGNRKTQTGTAASTSTIATANNRLSSSTGALVRTYTYDASGNAKTFSNRTLNYNNRGRLSSIAVAGATTSYLYNVQGARVRKSGALTRYFVYDERGHLLGEYDASGALVQELVWLGDIPVASLRSNGSGGIEVFYIHSDQLNTPRKVTRSTNGAAMWTWESDPFGQALPNENPAGQGVFQFNLRFAGQYYDAESGLHYNYFRDYDPATGRYIQSDSMGLRGGLNTYAYTSNQPISAVDPDGLYELTGTTVDWSYSAEGVKLGKTRGYLGISSCSCSGCGTTWTLDGCSNALDIRVQIHPNLTESAEAFARRSENDHISDFYRGVPRIVKAGTEAEKDLKQRTFSSKSACEKESSDVVTIAVWAVRSAIEQESADKYDRGARPPHAHPVVPWPYR